MTTDPSIFLTASEQVFLQGEKFAEKGGFLNKYKLMHTDQEVSLSDLITNVIAVAFLTSEKAGSLRLEVRKKKALFGLAKVTTVFAEPIRQSAFPLGSLEATFYGLAVELQSRKAANEVSNIIYAWLREDAASPWAKAAQMIQAGLGTRKLVDVFQEKKLKIFTVERYELPEATRALAASLPAEPIQNLLASYRDNRPEEWKQLVTQIKQGIDRRREQSDDD